MKIVLLIISIIAIFCIVGKLEVTFNPFSISMPYWFRAVGWFLIWLGITLLTVGERNNAYKDGLEQGSKITIEIVKEKMK